MPEYPETLCLDIPENVNPRRIEFETLQGIVNRDGPHLFLGRKEDRWMETYVRDYGIRPRSADDGQVLAAFANRLKGLVVYDDRVDGAAYVAATLGGLDDLLPVSNTIHFRDQALFETLGLDIVLDLRGRFADSVEAYEWALDNLMPRSSRTVAHSVLGPDIDGVKAGPWKWPGMDWAVSQRGFVFRLTCADIPMESYGYKVGGSPDQARLYKRILEALEPNAEITGFGEPEGHWISMVSRAGHYAFHYGTNASFHAQVKARGTLRQSSPDGIPRADDDSVFVCLMASEGDTMKGPLTFYYESWNNKERGEYPLNWGINPIMATRHPAMMETLYREATPNDCFFAGASGAGYAYLGDMSQEDLEAYARHVADLSALADIRVFDVWEIREADLSAVTAILKPLGLTVKNRGVIPPRLPDGTPTTSFGPWLWYWQNQVTGSWSPTYKKMQDDEDRAVLLDALVKRLEEAAASREKPCILPVYTDIHNLYNFPRIAEELQARLPQSMVLARLDSAFQALRDRDEAQGIPGSE